MGYKRNYAICAFLNLLLILVFVLPAEAQRYNFKSYSVNNGLPHSQVHGLFQTHDGYLWAGTYGGGLAKFDGEEFTTYTTEDGLKDNSIEIIFEDSNENLWVTTYQSGIAKMEGDEFIYPFDNSTLDTADVFAVDEMRNGDLWIGTYDAGIFIYDGSELNRITTEDGLVNNSIWDFWEAENGDIWIATSGGISILKNNQLKEGKEFQNFTTEDGLSGSEIYRVIPDSEGSLWFATSNGITVWDGSSFSTITELAGTELGYIYDIISASEGSIWVGTYSKGVFVYSDGTAKHITENNGLSSNYIYDLYEDDDGNVWIATDEDGINRYEGEAFTFYGTESGVTSQKIYSLHEDREGNIWVGTSEGIFNFKDGSFKSIGFPEGYESSKEVWAIEELANGDLLFLMPDNAIYRYDGKDFSNYSETHNLDLWFTYDLYVDQDNTCWVTTEWGVFQIDNEKVTHYTAENGLPSDVVYQVYKHNGYLWFATYSGISRFDGSSFKNYTTADGINHRYISFITSDGKGNLWLGTGGGVSLLDLDENGDVVSIDNFGKEIGMKSLTTQVLWFDESGTLWQGTNGGIHRLDVPGYWETGNMELMHYRLTDNGIGIETNQGAVLPIDDNRVLFGTMEGVLELDPNKIEEQTKDLNLHITNVQRNSQEIEWDQYVDSLSYKFGRLLFPEVTFPYGQHTYSINYKAPFFGNTSNEKFRYKLEGFDDEWSGPTSSKTAIFTNLDPGDYNFIVQVKANDSEWSQNEAHYQFAIAHPFWQTYWFYGLIALSTIGLIYGYIRFRVGSLEKQRLEELVDEQTKDLQEALAEKEVLIKEIHHRVKNNLAVISGLLELQRGYAENDFVNRVLSESQRRVQSISMIHEKLYQNERLAEIDFEKYIRELVDIIAYSFNYTDKEIEVDIDIDDFKLGVSQGIPCGLMLNELVSNSYEHAFTDQENGKIEISAEHKQEGKIKLVVKDDGKGLPEDFSIGENGSLGLTLIDTLSGQLQGEYVLENTENGMQFILEFEMEEPQEKVPV
ncbi:two-component regulator propeller domain-containing protein [Fodinibius sp. AD559]|uniref:two-component regulator propeller domain-containing protein n=1 Tax=Fodinibius sp. AD559 TaxID=3424179 RepID=UPI004046F48D